MNNLTYGGGVYKNSLFLFALQMGRKIIYICASAYFVSIFGGS